MAQSPSDTPLNRRAILAGSVAAVPLSLGLAGTPAQADPAARPGSVLVEPRRCRQVIRGFGGMTHAIWIGELTPSQCDTVFDNGTDDLGFTILRIPVPEDRANWSVDLATAQAAVAKGALVFASPWNPPEALVELFERVDEVPNGSQYEAETAALVNAHIATDNPGYQGEGYAHFDGVSDASVEFTSYLHRIYGHQEPRVPILGADRGRARRHPRRRRPRRRERALPAHRRGRVGMEVDSGRDDARPMAREGHRDRRGRAGPRLPHGRPVHPARRSPPPAPRRVRRLRGPPERLRPPHARQRRRPVRDLGPERARLRARLDMVDHRGNEPVPPRFRRADRLPRHRPGVLPVREVGLRPDPRGRLRR